MRELHEHVWERQERVRRMNSRLEVFFADPRRARLAFLCMILAAAGLSLIFSDLGWFPR